MWPEKYHPNEALPLHTLLFQIANDGLWPWKCWVDQESLQKRTTVSIMTKVNFNYFIHSFSPWTPIWSIGQLRVSSIPSSRFAILRAPYQVLLTHPNSLFTNLLHISSRSSYLLGGSTVKYLFLWRHQVFLKVCPIHFHLISLSLYTVSFFKFFFFPPPSYIIILSGNSP